MLGMRNATFPESFGGFCKSEAKLLELAPFAKKLKDFPWRGLRLGDASLIGNLHRKVERISIINIAVAADVLPKNLAGRTAAFSAKNKKCRAHACGALKTRTALAVKK